MQMHRSARQSNHRKNSFYYEEGVLDRDHHRRSPAPPASTTYAGRACFIEHHVSCRFDTLVGIAIKYGVEVADIKKMNGLATDRQMFALRSIQIPLPGRHPPSPCFSLSDASTPVLSPRSSSQKTSLDWPSDFLDTFQPPKPRASTLKVSAAMSSLQSYYGLQSDDNDQKPQTGPPRKSKSIANGFPEDHNGKAAAAVDHSDHAVRRRQKSEADVTSRSSASCLPELLHNGGAFSAITGKCLALRSNMKPTCLAAEDVQTEHDEMCGSEIRKCPSILSLQDHESSSLASLWAASKWPDLQVLTTAAIARPIFDGIQKPVIIWRNKTAVD